MLAEPARRQAMVGGRRVGPGSDVYLIAEIGVNHLGSAVHAMELARLSAGAGFDLVKIQLRTPELAVPERRHDRIRPTPWGPLTELEYRNRVEFDDAELADFAAYCVGVGVQWTASCWDVPALHRLLRWSPPVIKVPSARLRDEPLLVECGRAGVPVILSTGMSSLEEIRRAITLLRPADVLIAHAVSAYPCPTGSLNLCAVGTLARTFPEHVVGYSGHEAALWPSYLAIALGAAFVERHVTLSGCLLGTDHGCSLEPREMATFATEARSVRAALGDGMKRRLPVEEDAWHRLVVREAPGTHR